MTKVFIRGKGQVDLSANDFVAEGGEGKIYAKGNQVFKVYHDHKKMIPSAKIAELSVLTEPNVVKPEDVLLDSKNRPVGYTMKNVPNAHPLCKLFTKAFRQRENVSDDAIKHLVKVMEDTIRRVHFHRILIVDLNEMNFLVSDMFSKLWFIDVDSWQTPSFPATALMESVRDRSVVGHKFTELSDWFSFAVVTFQMFVGIHPFKGKHPKIHGLEERMVKNVSVFNKDVTVPSICSSFSIIPKAWLDWYFQVFEKGERSIPPAEFQAVAVAVLHTKKVLVGHLFDVSEIGKYDSDVVGYYHSGGNEVVVTEKGLWLNGRRLAVSVHRKSACSFTPKMNRLVEAGITNGHVDVADRTNDFVVFQCSGKNVMSYQNRLYVQGNEHVYEIAFVESGKILVGAKVVGNCLEKATQSFPGVVLQNLLGSWFASFFPVSGQCKQVPMKELSGYKVLDAKFENGVLMVMAEKNGKYDRMVFRFDADWNHDVRVVEDVAYGEVNFATLDSGVCVCVNEEEKVEVFSNKKDHADLKVVEDPDIDGGCKLFAKGTKLLFARGEKLSSLTMKRQLSR